MTDLQTKNAALSEMHVELPFVVNEFKRVQIPPKPCGEDKTFQQLASRQQHKMMKRLIDHVKEL